MKKKLLFVIPSMDAGGAEKSLVNLLNVIDTEKYEVEVFLFSASGLFMNQLPSHIKILPKLQRLHTFQLPLRKSIAQFLLQGNWALAWSRFMFALIQRSTANKNIAEQYSWKALSKAISPLQNEYVAAIGFLEKSSIYFIVDKVKTLHKIGLIHTYYSKLGADWEFDRRYFSELNHLCAVSQECSEDLKETFPSLSAKISVMQNIVSADLIRKLSLQYIALQPKHSIISIGRLEAVKGFDMAIEAARILKEQNITFHWAIIGDGPERPHLESLIQQYHLQNHLSLLGLRANPYPYIRQAEVFVQCSRYEGKSIAIDEAKILAKPILLTNFTTAKDQIKNGENGIIVDMTPEAIAQGIIKYVQDENFRELVIGSLSTENFGTESEIEKFYQLID